MARGFIRNPLDVRLLILYILDHLLLPVTMAELTDLALCDDGVDYFQFATALGALTENGHVAESEEGLLSITEKGHDNCAICANELPLSVRTKCDRSTQLLNKELKQRDQIRAVITPVPNQERYTVELIIDDDAGNLLTLQMAVPDRQQATEFAQRFQKHPEALYHAVLSVLLDESER